MTEEHTMGAMRVYSETLSFDGIAKAIPLLRRYDLEVVVAVRPWDEPALPELARALAGGGVRFSLWPMLSDEEGRWASVYNADEFARFTLRSCDLAAPRDVLLDLEPPLSRVRPLVKIAGGHPHEARLEAERTDYARAAATLVRTVTELRARGITTSIAVWPLVALDAAGTRGWQGLLGTPVDELPADHVSVMMYTSILEGWSRGAVRRRDALALLERATARTVTRWGARAGVSLGCIGTGAFDDEPVYRTPAELAEDVAIARAAGCSALSLFDLGGVMSRPPAEAWLEAFTGGGAATIDASPTRRVRVARVTARAATWLLARRPFGR